MTHQRSYTPDVHEEPDSWHRHSAEEGMPQREHTAKVDTAGLMVIFWTMTAFLVVVIAACVVYFVTYTTDERQKKIETTVLAEDHWAYKREAEGRLGLLEDKASAYGWLDADHARAGQVSIPIEQAMAKVLEQYKAGGSGK